MSQDDIEDGSSWESYFEEADRLHDAPSSSAQPPRARRAIFNVAMLPHQKAACYGSHPLEESDRLRLIQCKYCNLHVKDVGYGHHMRFRHGYRSSSSASTSGDDCQDFLLSPPHQPQVASTSQARWESPPPGAVMSPTRSYFDGASSSRIQSPPYYIEQCKDLVLVLSKKAPTADRSASEKCAVNVASSSGNSDLRQLASAIDEKLSSINGRVRRKKRRKTTEQHQPRAEDHPDLMSQHFSFPDSLDGFDSSTERPESEGFTPPELQASPSTSMQPWFTHAASAAGSEHLSEHRSSFPTPLHSAQKKQMHGQPQASTKWKLRRRLLGTADGDSEAPNGYNGSHASTTTLVTKPQQRVSDPAGVQSNKSSNQRDAEQLQLMRRLMGIPGIAITAVPAGQSPIKKSHSLPQLPTPPRSEVVSPATSYEAQLSAVKTRLSQQDINEKAKAALIRRLQNLETSSTSSDTQFEKSLQSMRRSVFQTCVTAQSPRSDRSSVSTSASDDSYSSLEGVDVQSSALQSALLADSSGYRSRIAGHLAGSSRHRAAINGAQPTVLDTTPGDFRHPSVSDVGSTRLVDVLAKKRLLEFTPSPQRPPKEPSIKTPAEPLAASATTGRKVAPAGKPPIASVQKAEPPSTPTPPGASTIEGRNIRILRPSATVQPFPRQTNIRYVPVSQPSTSGAVGLAGITVNASSLQPVMIQPLTRQIPPSAAAAHPSNGAHFASTMQMRTAQHIAEPDESKQQFKNGNVASKNGLRCYTVLREGNDKVELRPTPGSHLTPIQFALQQPLAPDIDPSMLTVHQVIKGMTRHSPAAKRRANEGPILIPAMSMTDAPAPKKSRAASSKRGSRASQMNNPPPPVTLAPLPGRSSGRSAAPKHPIPILPAPSQQKQLRLPHAVVANAQPGAMPQGMSSSPVRYRAMMPVTVVSGPCQVLAPNQGPMTGIDSQPFVTVHQTGRRAGVPVCYTQQLAHSRPPNIVNVVSNNGTLTASVGPTVVSGTTAVQLQNGQVIFTSAPRRVAQPQLMCIQPKLPVQYQGLEPPPVLQAEVDVAQAGHQLMSHSQAMQAQTYTLHPAPVSLYQARHTPQQYNAVATVSGDSMTARSGAGETMTIEGHRRLVLREDMSEEPSHF